MKNKIKYLGLLGLLGLLGIITRNYGFFAFFGFFGFFGISVKSDERFYANAYKAGFYSFVVGLIGVTILIVAQVSSVGISLLAPITAAVFVLMLFTFIGCFYWLDRHDDVS